MAYSITSLKSLDMHLGAFIQDAYTNVSKENQPDGFCRFLDREERERVYRGRFDSPRSFLAAIRHGQKEKISRDYPGQDEQSEPVQQLILQYNQAKLPAIGYYRELNYTISTDEGYKSIAHDYFSQGLRGGLAHLAIDYRIVFAAYDVESLDAMVIAFLLRFHIANNMEKDPEFFPERIICRHPGRGIAINAVVDGQTLPLSANFSDPTNIGATHVPGEHEDGRIYAAEVLLTINMPIIAGVSVEIPEPSVRVCIGNMPIPPMTRKRYAQVGVP